MLTGKKGATEWSPQRGMCLCRLARAPQRSNATGIGIGRPAHYITHTDSASSIRHQGIELLHDLRLTVGFWHGIERIAFIAVNPDRQVKTLGSGNRSDKNSPQLTVGPPRAALSTLFSIGCFDHHMCLQHLVILHRLDQATPFSRHWPLDLTQGRERRSHHKRISLDRLTFI